MEVILDGRLIVVEIVGLEYRWIVWMVKCGCKAMILWEQDATS